MKTADFSIPVVEKKFDHFNKIFFNGKLFRPTMFTITNSKTALGLCKVKNNATTISLSSYYEVSEEEMENTLIHEMIHLYQHQVNKEKMTHKGSFRTLAAQIDKMSNGKYIITRTNSRKEHKLSIDGQKKEERRALNAPMPTIAICKEVNQYGEEYAWFIRITDNKRNQFVSGFLPSSITLIGFIYDKPTTWIYRTPTCRKSFRGKKLTWREFNNLHAKDVIPFIQKV